jgi:Glycosyl transferase family 2
VLWRFPDKQNTSEVLRSVDGALMPYVSVIIPAYNAAGFITDSYQSVVAQTLSDWEIIFVNDASQDDTLRTVQSLAAADKRVKVVDLPVNSGPAGARNAALAVAEGDWIALLDADDRYSPDRLEVLTNAGVRSGADIVLDNLFVIDPISRRTAFFAFEQNRSDIATLPFSEFLRNNQSDTFFQFGYLKPVIRRGWFVSSNIKYPEMLRHGEDFVFLLGCYARGARVILLSKPYYHYSFQYSQTSGTKSPTTRTEVHFEPLLAAIEGFLEDTHLASPERSLLSSTCEATREAMLFLEFRRCLKNLDIGGIALCLRHPIRLFRGIYFAKRRDFLWRRQIKMHSA